MHGKKPDIFMGKQQILCMAATSFAEPGEAWD
jgi:hypothetical protein